MSSRTSGGMRTPGWIPLLYRVVEIQILFYSTLNVCSYFDIFIKIFWYFVSFQFRSIACIVLSAGYDPFPKIRFGLSVCLSVCIYMEAKFCWN
jgi:hypothetical protein